MFKTFYTIITTLMLCASTAVAEPVRGGLHIGDFSVSIGHYEYRQHRDSRGYLVRIKVWVPNEADSYGYVKINHHQQYEIRLGSSHVGECDAKIEIDGKEVGVFRVCSNSAIIIERSVKDTGRFTFLRNGTREYFEARLDRVPVTQRGLVKVTFYPDNTRILAREEEPDVPHRATARSGDSYEVLGSKDLRSGGTGLTGKSGQEFRDAHAIRRDYSRTVTINLRLVEEEQFRASKSSEVRPLEDVRNYGRTTTPRSNSVPPPVEH